MDVKLKCVTCLKQINLDILNLQAKNYQKDAIRDDFKKTGKCNLQIAKELFTQIVSSFALQKNSPYTKSISQG
jgi:hypothetical protein